MDQSIEQNARQPSLVNKDEESIPSFFMHELSTSSIAIHTRQTYLLHTYQKNRWTLLQGADTRYAERGRGSILNFV